VSAVVIDGRAVAADVRREVAEEIAVSGVQVGLATVLVGDDAASEIYVRGKIRASEEVGITSIHHRLPADVSQGEVAGLIAELNGQRDVSGILLQLPVPDHLDGQSLTASIDPDKDVDGLTPISAGRLLQNRAGLRPATPSGCIELLDRHGVQLEGANAVVVGRSDLVGRPVAQLLLHRNATVTMCHSRTRDLAAECRRADVLIAAVGRPRLVQGDWIKPGAAVIDVGINRTDDGLVGDVDFDAAAEHAGLITPVPGGVGPMTIAMLLRNTLQAALAQQQIPA
jgi:methylenetetrahydrofolate dehydrogenase (NADP+) / methenyltetrahydrofolate cyclohydrolase